MTTHSQLTRSCLSGHQILKDQMSPLLVRLRPLSPAIHKPSLIVISQQWSPQETTIPLGLRWKSGKASKKSNHLGSAVGSGEEGTEFNADHYKATMDKTLDTLQKSFADIKTSRTDPRRGFLLNIGRWSAT
jgi:hypothetical protein